MRYQRIFLIVLDSLGIGAMEDAAEYGDLGTNTLRHILESAGPLSLPNFIKLGISGVCPFPDGTALPPERGFALPLREASRGKDTMTGHWEMMGIKTQTPFRTFTETGFPPELIAALERETGYQIMGNKAASGTEILDELGERQLATGELIVYTSGDSVLQICGNEDVMGLPELYRCCEIARSLTLKEEWRVGRVIARPYVGKKAGEFRRTANRRDYALSPGSPTVLDALKAQGADVIGVGKISDIFNGQGLTESFHSESSVHGMEQTMQLAAREFTGLCFVNLVDFDALWGHRRNPVGYGRELCRFDEKLGELLPLLRGDDLLLLTADHGNDPTHTGTDHTREQVFLCAYSPSMTEGRLLPRRDAFADIGATIADNFSVPLPEGLIGTPISLK